MKTGKTLRYESNVLRCPVRSTRYLSVRVWRITDWRDTELVQYIIPLVRSVTDRLDKVSYLDTCRYSISATTAQ